MTTKYILALMLATFCVSSFGFGETDTAIDSSSSVPSNGIVLNFHDVPLNTVLNYLSAKAGLIIVTDAALQGSVSVVAKQSIVTNEIVELLNGQLRKNNLTAILEGRTLRIMDAERAKTFASTPVKVATGPKQVGMTDEIVTEILPVNTLKPAQLVKDLASLIPSTATVTANDAGSVVIMTAPERDIHRVSEIIAALDSSSVSEIEVFALKYADAKSVASELKEIFQTADSDISRAGTRSSFGGPGGPGGPGGGPGFGFPEGGGESNDNGSKNGQTRAAFISDDQMNAIVASAPPDYMRTVTNVIAELDKPSAGVTEIRVFRLKHADPTEVAEELGNLFPSNNSNSDQNGRTMGFQFDPFQQQSSGNSSQSDRMKRQSTVLAVADRRSEAVIVTASRDSMPEIQRLVASLDEGNQGVTHVTAFALASADAASVQQTLAGLFQSQGSFGATQTTSALSARMQANNNSQSSSATTTTSGFGTSSSGASTSH
jgi:type II secretory pathway component GspD/PulD (secretin)